MAKKGTTTTNKTTTDPRLQRVQDGLYELGQNTTFNPYGGDRVQGVDPAAVAALKSQYAQGMGAFGQGFNLLSGQMGQTPDASPFQNQFQSQVADAANVGYDSAQAQAFNKLDQNAAAKQGFGNSRLGLSYGAAAGDIANQRGQFMGNLQYKGYNDSMDRARQQQQDQRELGQGFLNLGRASASDTFNMADYQRGIGQQSRDADYEEFLREQDDPYKRAGLMALAGQGQFGHTQTNHAQKGWLDNIMGMAGTIGGALIPGGGLAKAAMGLLGGGGGGGGDDGVDRLAPSYGFGSGGAVPQGNGSGVGIGNHWQAPRSMWGGPTSQIQFGNR